MVSDRVVLEVVQGLLLAEGTPPLRTLPPTLFRHRSLSEGHFSLYDPHSFTLPLEEWAGYTMRHFQSGGGDGFVLCFVASDDEGDFDPEGQDWDYLFVSIYRLGDVVQSYKVKVSDYIEGTLGEPFDLQEIIPDLGISHH